MNDRHTVTAPDPAALDRLLAPVGGLARRFEAAGHRLWLVGGIVRDLVMGAIPPGALRSDLDLTTDALPAEVAELVAPLASTTWEAGARFGTIGARIDGHDVEVTTHRAEVYDPESRKPVVRFAGTDLTTDLSRRDFTVNAMAVEVTGTERSFADPFGGREDLAAHRLRTPLDAVTSFRDDPLRMLRAARFVARFDLRPVPEVIDAVGTEHSRLSIVSAERIGDELTKLLVVPGPAPGLQFLAGSGLLGEVVPELAAQPAASVDATARRLDRVPAEPCARYLALCWELAGAPSDPAHDRAQAATAVRRRLRAVRVPTELQRRVVDGVSAADWPLRRRGSWGAADLRRLAVALGPAIGDLCSVWRSEPHAEMVDAAEDLEAIVAAEGLPELPLPLDGAAVMARLGIGPGPLVGEALGHLRELRIERGPLEASAAEAALDRWWEDRAGR